MKIDGLHILRKMGKRYRQRGLWLFASFVVQELLTTCRSKLVGKSLAAKGLKLGASCRIVGIRHIEIGDFLFVRRELWMEAIEEYGGQTFDPCIKLGRCVSMSERVHISCISRIEVGNNVLFGSNVYIADHSHGAYAGDDQSSADQPPAERDLQWRGDVYIGDNVWIGDNVVVLGPANIGSGCVIGANSIVSGTVPPCSVAVGSPMRVVKEFDSTQKQWIRA